MLKRIAAVITALLIVLSACAEPALTVGNTTLSDGEVRAFAWSAGESYRDTAQYYRDYLQLDYWALTYPGGMTVEQSILTDAFMQLVTMLALYNTACMELPALTPFDISCCEAEADNWYSSLTSPAFTHADAVSLFEKQLLAERMYALNVLETAVDTDEVEANLDPASYTVYNTEYLYSLADDVDIAADMLAADDFELTAKQNRYISCGTLLLDSSADSKLIAAVSTLQPGEKSGTVKTDYGLFIFKLTETDTSSYQSALNRAVYEARVQAYEAEYTKLYQSVSYTIHDSFRGAFVLR